MGRRLDRAIWRENFWAIRRHWSVLRAARALAASCRPSLFCSQRGRSSVVEHQLPKLSVEGSIPFARSNDFNRLSAFIRIVGVGVISEVMTS